ncbi:SDR family NAD(P)-dependent oxidoreductase [Sphingomonas sp. 35-24ZXX]|uniref:SDR family NAD(P)-dependent oxidoreductase n=1 Tax=Sphingomonas sp. 35-24ZXX TaxID=1545915 RepID=UPI00053BDD8D|nr:SDR family NAD(P)-dependent oxidoreductase [Sphingomonas sp. 35-24ZXX]
MPIAHDFVGKVAVVTGGGEGIGAETAMQFARAGATVVIAGRTAPTLERTASAITSQTGSGCIGMPADVTDEQQCILLVDQVLTRFGRIDVLVNNAGGARQVPIRQFRTDKYLAEFDLNLHSAFYCARAAASSMMAQGCGAIVNVSSLAGVFGTMGVAPYAAAKAGLQMFTRVSAAEWGPRGIRVNCVAAGLIATEKAKAKWARTGFDEGQAVSGFALRRAGMPEDVAQAILFLAGDGASYISGETLVVGGGPQLKGMIDVD